MTVICGCHSIRPLSSVDNQFYETVSQRPLSVGLIMNQDYRNYKSKDRGNDWADPQTYYLGEAITPLTVSYFEKGFKEVRAYDERPKSAKSEDFFIQPEIRRFENDVSFSEQEIYLILGAFIFDKNLKLIDEAEVSVRHSGHLGFFGPTKSSRKIVSLAIQKGLGELLAETNKKISTNQ